MKVILVIGAIIVVFIVLEIYLRLKAYPRYYIKDKDEKYLSEDLSSLTTDISKAASYHPLNITRNKALRLVSEKYPDNSFSLKKIQYMKVEIKSAPRVKTEGGKKNKPQTLADIDKAGLSDLDKLE